MEIHVNGRSYIIDKLERETDEILSTRIWFIIKQNPTNDVDFIDAEKWSTAWYYKTYYKCTYMPEVEEKIANISKLLYE